MKRKLIYLLLVFCGLGIFSSAKQNGKNCGKETNCSVSKQKIKTCNASDKEVSRDMDLFPMQLLLLGV